MTSSPPPRRRYASGEDRRARILEAALLRFGRDGYRRTSLARVAEDAGITDAGLLHHFRDKQQLLLAVMELWHERQDVLWAGLEPGTTVRQIFGLYLRGMAELLRQPGLVELAVVLAAEALSPDHPAHEFFATRQERSIHALADQLRHGSESGELRNGLDHVAIARECIALDQGLRLQWLACARSFDLIALSRCHIDRLLRAITADGRGL